MYIKKSVIYLPHQTITNNNLKTEIMTTLNPTQEQLNNAKILSNISFEDVLSFIGTDRYDEYWRLRASLEGFDLKKDGSLSLRKKAIIKEL